MLRFRCACALAKSTSWNEDGNVLRRWKYFLRAQVIAPFNHMYTEKMYTFRLIRGSSTPNAVSRKEITVIFSMSLCATAIRANLILNFSANVRAFHSQFDAKFYCIRVIRLSLSLQFLYFFVFFFDISSFDRQNFLPSHTIVSILIQCNACGKRHVNAKHRVDIFVLLMTRWCIFAFTFLFCLFSLPTVVCLSRISYFIIVVLIVIRRRSTLFHMNTT